MELIKRFLSIILAIAIILNGASFSVFAEGEVEEPPIVETTQPEQQPAPESPSPPEQPDPPTIEQPESTPEKPPENNNPTPEKPTEDDNSTPDNKEDNKQEETETPGASKPSETPESPETPDNTDSPETPELPDDSEKPNDTEPGEETEPPDSQIPPNQEKPETPSEEETDNPSEITKHTITINIDPQGTITCPTQVEDGQNVVFTVVPDEGYEISSISHGIPTENNQWVIYNVTSDIEIVIRFKEKEKKVFVVSSSGSNEHGGVSHPNSINAGETLTIKIEPKEGYRLESIKINDVDKTESVSNNVLTVENVQCDINIVFAFKEIENKKLQSISASINRPTYGESPSRYISVTTNPENGISSAVLQWYYNPVSKSVDHDGWYAYNSSAFKEDLYYAAYVSVSLNDEYTADNNVYLTINGKSAEKIYREGNRILFIITYEKLPIPSSSAYTHISRQEKPIDSVNVILSDPENGTQTTAAGISASPAGSVLHSYIKWYESDGKSTVSKAEENKEYLIRGTVVSEIGYKFTPATSIEINGQNAEVISQSSSQITFVCTYSTLKEQNEVDYQIIDGLNSIWNKNMKNTLTFRSSADIQKFVKVLVDDEVVDMKNYIAKSGSTIITFNAPYLETLSEGEHSIEICSTDGSAKTVFTIEHAHELMEIQKEEATCINDGQEKHWTCECGKIFADDSAKREVIDLDELLIEKELHTITDEYCMDENNHWLECIVCKTIISSTQPHEIVNNVCNICGYAMESQEDIKDNKLKLMSISTGILTLTTLIYAVRTRDVRKRENKQCH